MYKVTLYDRGSYPNGGQVLLDTSSQNLGVTAASYEGKLNEAGSFTFSIIARHPLYDSIESLKTYVSVEEEGLEIFWGRVILVRKMPLTGTKQVTCEGALAFLMDAELAPDSDNVTMTPEGYFRYCITQFNELIGNDPARRLIVGTINVTDSAVSTTYKNGSWTEIQSVLKSKVVDLHDGLLSISRNGTEHYINWTTQIGVVNPQRIELGTNVVNQSSSESGEDVFTYVRATGADNLTYGPVLLDSEMETKYGKIIRTISFGDVSSLADLQAKTEAYISKLKDRLSLSVDINFVDMHYVDNTEVKVHLGDVFTNISGYEGTRYTAAAITRDLLNPANDKMTPKTDKDLMPSISSSGANRGSSSGGSSGGRRSLSGSSSHWYKHIHETEENLALTAKNIEITANEQIRLIAHDVEVNAENISSVSAVANTLNTKWTEFTGTGIYQNREYINTLAGKYQIDQDGTVVLKQGTSFKIDINGSSTNVGTLLDLHDNRVKDLGQLAAAYKGSYSYQNNNELGAIVGHYILDTTKDANNPWVNVTPSGSTEGINPKELGWYEDVNNRYVKTNDTKVVANKQYYIPGTNTKLVYDVGTSGGGYRIRENGVEYGVYTDGNLTGGLIVDKINDGSVTAKIKAERVILGEDLSNEDLETWAAGAKNGTGVFAKYFTAQNFNAIVADIELATFDGISTTGDITVGGALYVDVDGQPEQINVLDITISNDGNTLTIYKIGGSFDFRKAVSLRGEWNGSTYSVSATSGAISGTVPSTRVYFGIDGSNSTVYAKIYKDNPNDPANVILTNELTLEENVASKKVSLKYATLEKGYVSTARTYNAGWDYGLTQIVRTTRTATNQELTVKSLSYNERWAIVDTKTSSDGSTSETKYIVEAPARSSTGITGLAIDTTNHQIKTSTSETAQNVTISCEQIGSFVYNSSTKKYAYAFQAKADSSSIATASGSFEPSDAWNAGGATTWLKEGLVSQPYESDITPGTYITARYIDYDGTEHRAAKRWNVLKAWLNAGTQPAYSRNEGTLGYDAGIWVEYQNPDGSWSGKHAGGFWKTPPVPSITITQSGSTANVVLTDINGNQVGSASKSLSNVHTTRIRMTLYSRTPVEIDGVNHYRYVSTEYHDWDDKSLWY